MSAREELTDLVELASSVETDHSEIDRAVDAIIAAGYRKPRTIGYIVVGNTNNALDWDYQMHGTVNAAIGSLCSPYQPFDRDPESPNYWGKEYRICPVSEMEVTA